MTHTSPVTDVAPQQPADPADWTATQLLEAYRSRALSPVEATEAVLARIAARDAELNAYVFTDPDQALAQARESEQRWATGQPAGSLDGVPTSIKDIFLTRGWPTLRGSRTINSDQPWEVDAPTVARLREAHAVFLGKTTTPELAWKGVTDNPREGITRNPWNPALTPGGSSGGAAAAVAAGMGPLAIGTDGGGSVRIPAAFCGIATLKPTYGLIPHYPASPYGTLAHAGPMTRTIADSALMLDVLTRPDPRDWAALATPTGSFVESLGGGVAGLRIAVSPGLGFAHVDPEIEAAVQRAGETFTELGAHVETIDPGFDDPVADFHTLWFSGAAKSVEHLNAEQRALMDPGLAEVCELGLRYSAQDYLEAVNTRMRLGTLMGEFHQRYDLLLTATVPVLPFEAGREAPAGWDSPRWSSWTPLTYPFNMTQQPAASVNCGFSASGLPIGLQIVGARHSDALVLSAADAFERSVTPGA